MSSSHGKSIIGGIKTQHLKTGLKVLVNIPFKNNKCKLKHKKWVDLLIDYQWGRWIGCNIDGAQNYVDGLMFYD
jgi:hypothetical protein